MYSVYGLIECSDRRYWLNPIVYYKDELLARVTADHLNKMMGHFDYDDLSISFFVRKEE